MERNIYHRVQEIKKEEQKLLIEAVKQHGVEMDSQYVYDFSENPAPPIAAGYIYDDPCDIVIGQVSVDKDSNVLNIIGADKNARDYVHDINPNDIFAGHIDFIIDAIV